MDSNQTAIQTLQQQRGFPIRMFASMLLLTITIIVLIWYSFLLGHKMSSKFHPLVDAAMEIKLEATTAHLWLEEVISGDRNSTLDDIQQRFDSSIWYANAMLEGGKNREGQYFALTDNKLRAEIIHVINLVTEIKAMTQTRYEMIGTLSAGNAINEQYDATFDAFLKRADDIETSIQRAIADDLSSYDNLQILLIALIIAAFLAFLAMLYSYEKRRVVYLRSLKQNISEIKVLSALLPICSSCKKVRDDKGYWNQIESYICTHTDSEFTHGICPDCAKELYGDYLKDIKK